MSIRKTNTRILAESMRILARDIQTDNGIANMAILEAAERLTEQLEAITHYKENYEQNKKSKQS